LNIYYRKDLVVSQKKKIVKNVIFLEIQCPVDLLLSWTRVRISQTALRISQNLFSVLFSFNYVVISTLVHGERGNGLTPMIEKNITN